LSRDYQDYGFFCGYDSDYVAVLTTITVTNSKLAKISVFADYVKSFLCVGMYVIMQASSPHIVAVFAGWKPALPVG